MLKRTADIAGTAEGIIDNKWNLVFGSNSCNCLKVGNMKSRIADRFHIESLGVTVDSSSETFGTASFNKLDTYAETTKGNLELVIGSTIEMA